VYGCGNHLLSIEQIEESELRFQEETPKALMASSGNSCTNRFPQYVHRSKPWPSANHFFLSRGFISLSKSTIVNKKAGINQFAKYDKRTPKEDKNLLPHQSGMLGDVSGYKRPTCSTR
jgi:hypothetical protein